MSPATGAAEVDFDTVAHTMRVQATFAGLTAPVSAAHIHAATDTPGTGNTFVATPLSGFPTGVMSGAYDHTFNTLDSGIYTFAFLTGNGATASGAESALFTAMDQGTAYLDIHDAEFPGGEIRGFLAPVTTTAVPAPPAVVLVGIGLGVGAIGRRFSAAVRPATSWPPPRPPRTVLHRESAQRGPPTV